MAVSPNTNNTQLSYKTQVRKGGVPTEVIAGALTQVSDKIVKIDGSVFNVISPLHDIVISDGVGGFMTIDKINYNEGYILLTASIAAPLFIDYHYIPTSFVAGAKDYSLEIAGDTLDKTSFHDATDTNEGFRSRVSGLIDVTLSFSKFSDISQVIKTKKLNREDLFVKVNPGLSKTFISGWFLVESNSNSGDVGGLEDESYSLSLNGSIDSSFSYITKFTDAQEGLMLESDLISNYFIN